MYLCYRRDPPKNGLIALWPSTNGAIPYFFVLPGSGLSITEITQYTYFSPLQPSREFIKVSKILYQWILLLNQFCLGETSYLHFTTRVFGHSAITPFLGRERACASVWACACVQCVCGEREKYAWSKADCALACHINPGISDLMRQ